MNSFSSNTSSTSSSSRASSASSLELVNGVANAEWGDGGSSPQRAIWLCVHDCGFSVVRLVAKDRGWRVVPSESYDLDGERCVVHWVGRKAHIARVFKQIEPRMKINHIPGVKQVLARKSGLADTLKDLQRQLIPESWVLPRDEQILREIDMSNSSQHVYIAKPHKGSMGQGVVLACSLNELLTRTKRRKMVVQRYVDNPMLLDGLKFDIRLYLLICAVPCRDFEGVRFRGFLFEDGLLRLCTEPYTAPTRYVGLGDRTQRRTHLTNYAVNKGSGSFQENVSMDNVGSGHKRSLRWFLEHIREEHGQEESNRLWNRFCSLCHEVIDVSRPLLETAYSETSPWNAADAALGCRCFQLVGLDVLLDENHKAWLLEVNQIPSLSTSSPLDKHIKQRLLEHTFAVACDDFPSSQASDMQDLVSRSSASDFVSVFPHSSSMSIAVMPDGDVTALEQAARCQEGDGASGARSVPDLHGISGQSRSARILKRCFGLRICQEIARSFS